jgi:hypothetical protein
MDPQKATFLDAIANIALSVGIIILCLFATVETFNAIERYKRLRWDNKKLGLSGSANKGPVAAAA